ncbi:MAG: response regulator [Clostridia bacterium]|nr:response regulator [Clostridia bacterium]
MQPIESVELKDKEHNPFYDDLIAGKQKVAVAQSLYASGEVAEDGIILLGVPMETSELPYKALIAGLKNDDIVKMLSEKNTDGSSIQHFDTHIIRDDGTFVMHGEEEDHKEQPEDYFDLIRKSFDLSNPQGLISSLEKEMARMSAEANDPDVKYIKPFSQVLNTNSSHKHIYCQKLGNSEWFLVTVMDYADLDGYVHGLSDTLTVFMIVTCIVIIVLMSALFVIYFLMNKQNLKQLEEAKATAEEANKAKSDFLSNMSHDIRTPMNAIVGMTAIAVANMDDKEQVANCLKKISLSSRHLLGLINDVLDMSKIESGKMTLNMEELSLSEVVESIATIIQPQIKIKKQHFDIYVHDILAEKVYCDSVRLNQVLLNLLSNAYKFTPEKGKIELSLYQEESPLGDKYARTHIIVQDNGIGMSEEFQKKMFESFTREDSARVHKTEGTGLGMSITKYIVDSMHGTIDVRSKQGEGTRFHITVDLEIADTEEIDMVLPEWRMLVVDDDQMLCDTTVAALADIGVKAESTLDGESAIKKAVEAHDAGKNFDIILLDWKLPGIDGIETARRLHKKLGDNIPILLISAYDWSEIEDEAREAGISGFISKPLFKSTLFYGLRKFTEIESGEPSKAEQKSTENDITGKRILVAEDNDLNWEIAELLLTSAGLVVEHAENGQICVDKLLANKPGYYDAILMDVRMPVMNGLEATTVIRGLKKGYNKIPVIAMTADAFAEDMQKCLECGMNAHIAKPIDIDVVKATLAKFINSDNK